MWVGSQVFREGNKFLNGCVRAIGGSVVCINRLQIEAKGWLDYFPQPNDLASDLLHLFQGILRTIQLSISWQLFQKVSWAFWWLYRDFPIFNCVLRVRRKGFFQFKQFFQNYWSIFLGGRKVLGFHHGDLIERALGNFYRYQQTPQYNSYLVMSLYRHNYSIEW